VYYLIPLAVAGTAFLALELHARKLQNKVTNVPAA
jgi:hypothetical protein